MKFLKKNRKFILLITLVVIFIAGFFDLKYEGSFFQILPESFQTYIAGLFS